MSRRKDRLVAATATMLAIASAGTAVAQQGGLEQIVVTAERRETNLQDTPIAITAITEEAASQMVVGDMRELAAFVPNLTIVPTFAYGNSQPSITIRGIGAGGLASFGIASDPSVAVYIDGMYFGRNSGSVLSLAEIRQVDVLRGPQGTLFGRNTTGGAIVYKTYQASTDKLDGYVDLALGSFNERNLKGGINIPLSDKWAMRAAFADLNRDGRFKRGDTDLGGVDNQVARLAFHGEPADNLTFDASFFYTTSDTTGEPQDFVAFNVNPGGTIGRQILALSFALQAQGEPPIVANDPRILMDDHSVPNYCIMDDANPYTMGPECDSFRRFDMSVGEFKGTYTLNDHVTFSALTGVLQGNSDNQTDFIFLGTGERRFQEGFKSMQQEFQLTMTYDRWNAVAGLINFTEDSTEHEITRAADIRPGFPVADEKARTLAGIPVTRRNEYYGQHTRSNAVFGQVTYHATPKFDVTTGLRYTRDTKDGWIRYLPTAVFDERGPALVQGEKSWSANDWRLALQYHFTDAIMLYLSGTKAYQAGRMNDGSVEITIGSGNPIIGFTDPETVKSNEIGLRSEWFDHRLRVNATYFDMFWGNRTGVDALQDENDNFVFVSVNEPNITSKGTELDVTWAMTDSLTLMGDYSTNKTRQKDNPNVVLSNNAEEQWNLRLRHTKTLGNGGTLTSSLNYAHTGKTVTFDIDDNVGEDPNVTPGYAITSGRVTYTSSSGKWDVSLFGRNLLDEDISYGRWSLGFFYGGSGTDPIEAYKAWPRTFGASVRVNFGE